MSNGGKSMLQELADALAICMRVHETMHVRRSPDGVRLMEASMKVYDAGTSIQEAISILVGTMVAGEPSGQA